MLLIMMVMLTAVGCVERTISISSQPAGALVYLNDEEVGRTPVSVPFTFYGVYDVRLEKEGYKPLLTQQAANAPLWENPGPDLVHEMIPGAKVNIKWAFTLEPYTEPDVDALLGRAAQMRAKTVQTLE